MGFSRHCGHFLLLVSIPIIFSCQKWSPWKENPQHIAETFEEVLEEIEIKKNRLYRLMDANRFDGFLFSKVQNISWITGGICRSRYSSLCEVGGVSVLLMRSGELYLITADHQSRRLMEEGMDALGYTAKPFQWIDQTKTLLIPDGFIQSIVPRQQIGSDHVATGFPYIGNIILPAQASLTEGELERYRWLGKEVAESVEGVCRYIQPGMNEYEIESIMAAALYARGIQPAILMIAVDERLFSYASAFPGEARLKKYARFTVAGEKWGLIASVTRHVHLGPMTEELKAKHWATAKILTLLQQSMRPGKRINTVFEAYKQYFASTGFENAWTWSSPGGAAGYLYPQPFTSENTNQVVAAQAFACHPSILGTSCGDTFIVHSDSVEVVTLIEEWPKLSIEIDGKTYYQPNVLIR